jgi:hypothetical protein
MDLNSGNLNNGENINPQQNNESIETLDTNVNNNVLPDISNIPPKFSEPVPDDSIKPIEKKKKKRKVLIIILVILILLCGGFYYYDNYFITPKKVFEKGIDQANSSLVKNTTSANTYTGYVKANIKTTDLNVGGTINYAIDYSGQKILLDYDTKYKDQALLSGKAYLTSDKIYLYLNNIYNKYIYLDNSDSEFNSLFKKVDSTDLTNIENSLAKALKNSLTDEYYSKQREGTKNIYILTINKDNNNEFFKNLLTNLENDSTFIKSYANISNKSETDVKKDMDDDISKFSSNTTNNDDSTYVIKIYATMLTNEINKIEMNISNDEVNNNLVLNIVDENTVNYSFETNYQSEIDKEAGKERTTTTYSGTITSSISGSTTTIKITVNDSQNTSDSYDLEYSQTANGTVTLPDVSNAINYNDLSDTDILNIYTNLMNNPGFVTLYSEYSSKMGTNYNNVADDSLYSSDSVLNF